MLLFRSLHEVPYRFSIRLHRNTGRMEILYLCRVILQPGENCRSRQIQIRDQHQLFQFLHIHPRYPNNKHNSCFGILYQTFHHHYPTKLNSGLSYRIRINEKGFYNQGCYKIRSLLPVNLNCLNRTGPMKCTAVPQ